MPSEEERLFDTSDVSLIVPTDLECGGAIKKAFRTWLANRSGEVLFVTPNGKTEELRDLLADLAAGTTRFSFQTRPALPHKRDQLVVRIQASRGEITA